MYAEPIHMVVAQIFARALSARHLVSAFLENHLALVTSRAPAYHGSLRESNIMPTNSLAFSHKSPMACRTSFTMP